MKFLKLISIVALFGCVVSCKKEIVVTAITKDGEIVLSDGSRQPIPNYSDDSTVVLYVVRHAEKRTDQGQDPDLTDAGKARAERLYSIFKEAYVNRLVISNYKRTRQTLDVVKAHLDPPVETVTVDALPAVLSIELFQENRGKKLLVCHHSNSVPMILNYLTRSNAYSEIAENDFGNFYVVSSKEQGQTTVLKFRY